jgi:hypothetical protein
MAETFREARTRKDADVERARRDADRDLIVIPKKCND